VFGLIPRMPFGFPQEYAFSIAGISTEMFDTVFHSIGGLKLVGDLSRARHRKFRYSAPITLKSWLTKMWCGQLTPMLWASYSPVLSFTTRSTIPPG
jgi:hypothetical protein